MPGRLATAAPIRSERVRCCGSWGFGVEGQKTDAPNRLRTAGTSVRAASSMSPTPMIRPGARERSWPMEATSSAAKASMTVAAADAMTSPARQRATIKLSCGSCPFPNCSR